MGWVVPRSIITQAQSDWGLGLGLGCSGSGQIFHIFYGPIKSIGLGFHSKDPYQTHKIRVWVGFGPNFGS